jgi:phosphotransferase system enzyme I (PtsI)
MAAMEIQDDDLVVMDGLTGEIFVNPHSDLVDVYGEKRSAFLHRTEQLKRLKDVEAITTDGFRITLSGNISGGDDLEDVFANGGEGAGLLRTELLFMNRDSFPGEEEQFAFYKHAALQAKGKPVVVRTLDIGGDKQLPYFELPAEQNPFLGYRAIRISLDREDIFRTQLRAVLRASVYGDLKLMLPMISNVQELRAAKAVIARVREELTNEGIPFNPGLETGIMIEIPSAAVTADILAKEADFFSIGTNDLCQYTLAVDRMNDKISHLYDHFDPAVLRLIQNTIVEAGEQDIHAGMCGEMAGDPLATVLLLGMGLRDFSMSAASIPAIKEVIIKSSIAHAREICREIMEMSDAETIKAYLQQL